MMKRQGYRLHAGGGAFRRYLISFFMIEYDDQGRECGVRLTREETPLDMHRDTAPTFSLDPEDAQTLMDDLWRAGLRPTEGRQSEGVTAAQNRHLEDMRKLTFSKLGVEMP
jgi:hypothetical protein